MIPRLTRVRHEESGFTLVEMLIGMIVIAIAVVALVAVLSGLEVDIKNHRAHAATESATRNYAQALQARFGFSSTLAAPGIPTPSSTQMTLTGDASPLPTSDFYMTVERETVHVVSRSGQVLQIQRASNTNDWANPAEVTSHPQGALVGVVWNCIAPTDSLLTNLDYAEPTGSTTSVALSGAQVEYWNANSSTPGFVARNVCTNAGGTGFFDTSCFYVKNGSQADDIRPECSPTLRITYTTTANQVGAPGQTGAQNKVDTISQVILRHGKV